MGFKSFITKQVLRMKGVSSDQAEKIAEQLDKNPEIANSLKALEGNKEVKELFEKIKLFFNSDLYFSLDSKRKEINEWAEETFSWKSIGIKTIAVYKDLTS